MVFSNPRTTYSMQITHASHKVVWSFVGPRGGLDGKLEITSPTYLPRIATQLQEMYSLFHSSDEASHFLQWPEGSVEMTLHTPPWPPPPTRVVEILIRGPREGIQGFYRAQSDELLPLAEHLRDIEGQAFPKKKSHTEKLLR